LQREKITPISYLSGRFRTGLTPDAQRQMSAVSLQARQVSLPDSCMSVQGHEHAGQSLEGHVWSDGEQAIAFCGDFYNLGQLESLARELVGSRLRFSNVAHLLAVLLQNCPDRFLALANGKFAIARTGPWGLELVRDRIGEEQVYYATTPDGGLVFASSVRPLVAALPSAEFYLPDSVRVFETPVGDQTMFRGIRKLEPGSHLRLDERGRLSCRRYWQIQGQPPARADERELASQMRAILEASIRDRLPADVEVSAFLSGGQDSSWVSCTLAELGRRPVRAYTTAFKELDSVYNESRYAQRVAAHVGTQHIVLEPTSRDFCEHFPVTMAIFDEVKANAAHFTEYWIAKAAAEHGDRVLFSGYGADEALGGEVRYLVMYLDRRRAEFPPAAIDKHPMLANYGPLFGILRGCPQEAPEWEKYYALMRRGAPRGSEEPYQELVRDTFLGANQLVDQMGLADIAISGQPLLDSAKVNKYWGVDKVCPFLDPRVIEFAFSLPEDLKIFGLTTKTLLRAISRGRVPDEITDRTDKVGFAFPHNDPRYATFIDDLAGALSSRTGRHVATDASRGRYDRTALMAASEELIYRSYVNFS